MLVGCLALLMVATGFLVEAPAAIRAKVMATNEVHGTFVQRKTTAEGTAYVTKGTYAIRPGVDFTWKTREPFETTFYATPTNYVYSNEDEAVTKPLSALPGFAKLPAVDRGDFSPFFEAFDALYKEEGGKFFLLAKPKVTDLKRALVRVEAEGVLTNWTLRAVFPNQTVFVIDFADD